MECYAVILAGGKGERFWPLSTSRRPKQVLTLVGDKPMLALAVDRVQNLIPPERVFIITSADLVDVVAGAVPQVPRTNVVGEPVGRDTAAAVALGAALVAQRNPDAVFAVLTADHVIADTAAFVAALGAALRVAGETDVLVTMGIVPTFASTGFGYIDAGESLGERDGVDVRRVRRFVEKPDRATAESYLAAGHFFWNSGMFAWSVRSITAAFARHRPPLRHLIEVMREAIVAGDFEAALAREYAGLGKISVDYAILEKSDNIRMIRGSFDWDDVGSWPALEHHCAADADGNVVIGTCEAVEASGNIVYSKDRLTALIGVSDLVVVQADGVTLVCPKDRAQEIKRMVQRLAEHPEYRDLL